MIVFEKRIEELVEQLPYIAINTNMTRKPQFYWGRRDDLTQYMKVKGENYFPLIWLVSSPDKYERKNRVQRNCKFVIATRETNEDLLNTERITRSYEIVLNPIADEFLSKLRKSNISHIPDDTYEINKFPNYSESRFQSQESDHVVNDIWDALELTCTVEVNDRTLKTCT